jgi:hypothetical protein
MPPKLAEGESRKITLIAPLVWLAKVDRWRRHQPDHQIMPNMSEAIRRLVEKGLEAEAKEAKGRKPK